MKKLWILILLGVMLSGCNGKIIVVCGNEADDLGDLGIKGGEQKADGTLEIPVSVTGQ